MESYEDQLKRNLLKAVSDFNGEQSLNEVRNIYKNNFDSIKTRIIQIGARAAIEDVGNYNLSLSPTVSSNFLLLKDVNEAIRHDLMSKGDII